MLLLVALFVLSAIAALAAAHRLTEGRAELFAAWGVLWASLVVGPMYVLGLFNVLTRASVATSTVVSSLTAIAIALRPYDRPALTAFAERARDAALAPVAAMRITIRSNALLAVPLAIAMVYFAWQVVTAYYAPCWGDWDALWYHEPIIGFTIQNHGFRYVDLPPGLQIINGYERLGEVTQTWFALFGGRRVVDVTNFVFVPVLLGSMHGLASRFTRDRAIPIAWAAALFLMPGVTRLMRSTMVDVEGGALLLASFYFLTHPRFTRRRAILFLLAVTLAVGVKTVNLPSGAVACFAFAARVVWTRRELGGWRWASGLLFGGGALVLSMIAFTHVRAWIHFGNPIWPVGYSNPKLGIDFKGLFPYKSPGSAIGVIDANLPLDGLVERLLARPYTVLERGHTWHVDDYGFGVSWVLAPAALVACLGAPVVWAGRRSLAQWRKKVDPLARFAGQAAFVALFAIAGYYFSPSVHVPRYTIAALACAMAVVCWAMHGRRWQKGLHAIVFVVQVSSILMTYWVIEPRPWVFSPKEMKDLMHTPYPEREYAKRFRAPVHAPTGMARFKELHAGDVFAFDDTLVWPALGWNDDFSNRVEWLGETADPLGKAESLHATWIYTHGGTTLYAQLTKPGSGWKPVGSLENEQWGVVFHRAP